MFKTQSHGGLEDGFFVWKRMVFRFQPHQFSTVHEDSKHRPATFSAAKDTATLGVAAGMVESPERLKKSTASTFST